jgi:radical SAM protein with 4Fe4S-binding SPASM domain
MKLNYFPETDSLYIDLSERPSTDGRVISDGIVLDYDAAGNLVGIDIDNASTKVDLGGDRSCLNCRSLRLCRSGCVMTHT